MAVDKRCLACDTYRDDCTGREEACVDRTAINWDRVVPGSTKEVPVVELIPSPLLTTEAPSVLLYFQYEPDGRLTSPQVPTATNHDLAVPEHASEEAVHSSKSQLARMVSLVDRE